ncbi:MAG: SurA N-terminal domain-containing protein [Candidatus Omnitrophica bacterium]|nr:SurA N-terminal domain-containing protein [Candidatus Omnitrophota bacterium]
MSCWGHVLCLLFGVFITWGCGPRPDKNEEIVVSINDYVVTREEFNDEFRDSVYGSSDTPESRRKFLNALIDRKLILQYAQEKGFDKEPQFLKSIEKFWERSLLKVALDRKTIEIASGNTEGDWQAQRTEETKQMNDWMSELRRTARITVRESSLEDTAAQKEGR